MPHQVVHITGARPNFPKLAPVWNALRERSITQVIVHTGQHYDDKMSDIFFRDLELPRPAVNLGVGSGSHAQQTAALLVALERQFLDDPPDLVVVYGDINSTLAASLVATKMHIPLAHVEAGLRSFDMSMPEEANRLVTDRLADILLATSADAVGHLGREGVDGARVHFVGNPMIDSLLANRHKFDVAAARATHGLDGDYFVATLHRPGNVDDPDSVDGIVRLLGSLAELAPVVIPVHPRGRASFERAGLYENPRIRAVEPLGYIDFMSLVDGAAAVVTDSGGGQEETTVLGVPCLTMRPNTERPFTISHGTNELVTTDTVVERARSILHAGKPSAWRIPPLWDGRAGERIGDVLVNWLESH